MDTNMNMNMNMNAVRALKQAYSTCMMRTDIPIIFETVVETN